MKKFFMSHKRLWYKLSAMVLVLMLLVPILAACGGGGKEVTTPSQSPSPTATSMPTATPGTATPTQAPSPTPTATPTSNEPVKVGVIGAWSGSFAVAGLLADPVIALVEDQVKQAGGILGGRMVKVIKYDDRAMVAEAAAGVRKLVLQDNVPVIGFGGVTVPEILAASDACEEMKVLLSTYSPLGGHQLQNKYTIVASYNVDNVRDMVIDFALKQFKPKRVAVLAEQGAIPEITTANLDDAAKQFGIDVNVVYNETTVGGTTDYSPYLTKMKYEKPDVLFITYPLNESYLTIYKQVMELGGWGDIKVVSLSPLPASTSIAKLPGASGTYTWALWAPGMTYPGAKKFEEDFVKKYNRQPDPNQVFHYNSLWTAIKAIELAGTDTDREKIAQMARSGQLQWESPAGLAVFGPDGDAKMKGYMLQIGQGGTLTDVSLQ
jgi:branched-chain amino acid transport system substrate-binding protein